MADHARALIATHNLHDYAGSEITALELAIELRRAGWDVVAAALILGEPMRSTFTTHGIRALSLLDDRAEVLAPEYRLAWVQHVPTYHELFITSGLKAATIVYSSLSPFVPHEALPADPSRIDWIVANSPETRDRLLRSGADATRVLLFPNSVPSHFWPVARVDHAPTPRRIALISNHPPREMMQALEALAARHTVTHIGVGGRRELVTAECLLGFDAVISIGKTIPYCFALKIPVYCYDHFGGPGWITPAIFERCAHHNFSGRGFGAKAAGAIVQDIAGGYAGALGTLEFLHDRARADYDLRKNLDGVLQHPRIAPRPVASPLSPGAAEAIAAQHAYYTHWLAENAALRRHVEQLRAYVQQNQAAFWWKAAAPLRFFERQLRRWLRR